MHITYSMNVPERNFISVTTPKGVVSLVQYGAELLTMDEYAKRLFQKTKKQSPMLRFVKWIVNG